MKRFTLELTVTVPDDEPSTYGAVEESINAALNEPPCDWAGWFVGAATIVKTEHDIEPAYDGQQDWDR